MSVRTLGFATGKIGAGRGGKELNNALLDSGATAELIEVVYGDAGEEPFHQKLPDLFPQTENLSNCAATPLCCDPTLPPRW
jgi:hypothetical protein